LFLELAPEESGKNLDLQFEVKRKEKTAYTENDINIKKYTEAPANKSFKNIAEKVVEGKNSSFAAVRCVCSLKP